MTAKLLLVGAGAIAGHHARANDTLAEHGLAPLELHVTDRSPAALAAFTAERPTVGTHRSAAELLALPRDPGDIVVTATPPASHEPLARAALASGRHTLVEKPLALNPATARELAALASRQGLLLHCASSRFLGYPAPQPLGG
ncbi:MAG: Gfo/Idh/MocA family protein [Candidatus Nanopelagicales bacterium]